MNLLLIFLLVLFLYTLIWFVINLVLYFLSVALKRPVILQSFHGVAMLFLWLYNGLLGLGLLWFGVSLFLGHQFFWLLVYIIFGVSLIGGLFNILTMPFMLIQSYFASKLESFNFNEDIVRAEILDEKNNVVGISEGNSSISVRLAKYFIAFYLVNLFSLMVFPDDERTYQWGDYLLTPFFQIIGGTLIIGVPYMIYHKIRYKTFFPSERRYFLIKMWKVWIVIFVMYLVIALLIKLIVSR